MRFSKGFISSFTAAVLLAAFSPSAHADGAPGQCTEIPLLTSAETGGQPLTYIPSYVLPNFRRVNDWLYRGGEPNLDNAGLQVLRNKLGVSVILNLIGDAGWQPDVQAEKAAWLKMAGPGASYIQFPMTNSTIFVHPVHELSVAVDALLKAHARGAKVFVHCVGGRDRTGVVVAALRILNGCTVQQATAEYENADGQPYRAGSNDFPIQVLTDPRDPTPFFIPTTVLSLADFATAKRANR